MIIVVKTKLAPSTTTIMTVNAGDVATAVNTEPPVSTDVPATGVPISAPVGTALNM